MVHLFSIKGKNQSLHCLARVENGVYTIESINGHDATTFPALLVQRAKHRLASQYNKSASPSIPTMHYKLAVDYVIGLNNQ